jgi:hypothetical protein
MKLKQKDMKRLMLYTPLLVLGLVSCKKEQPTMADGLENCDCASEVSANFLMEEMATPIGWPHGEELTDTDTAYAGGNIHFKALEPDADYTWIIGAEEIHEREFYRYFGTNLAGQTLEMKLIVNKKPNLLCLPNDDGKDTVVRYLTLVSQPLDIYSTPHPLLEGMFRLKDDNMTDSVDMNIQIQGISDMVQNRIRITNYDGLGTVKDFTSIYGFNYRQLWFQGTCYEEKCTYKHGLDGLVTLELKPDAFGGCTKYLLKGRKLH